MFRVQEIRDLVLKQHDLLAAGFVQEVQRRSRTQNSSNKIKIEKNFFYCIHYPELAVTDIELALREAAPGS